MTKLDSLFHHFEPTLQELEETYRLHYLQGDIAQTRLILLLIIAGNIVFLPSDYFLFKQSRMLYLVLTIRSVFILGSYAFTLLIRRITQPKVYDRLVFFCLILVAAFQAMSAASRPPTYYGTFAFDLTLVLCCYLVIPNILAYRVVSAAVASLFSLAIFFMARTLSQEYLVSIPVALLGVNIIGFVSSTRAYTYRRQQYRATLEAKELNEKLTILAETDSLTGVSNRRKFVDLGAAEFRRYQRYARPFSLAMIDVDYFKRINDQFGHEVGDEALKTVAQIMQTGKRVSDKVGRLGGEEFGLLLPETPIELAVSVVERIRSQVQMSPIFAAQTELSITISAGVSEIRSNDVSLEDVMRRADQLLYQAKQSGRNRVEA